MTSASVQPTDTSHANVSREIVPLGKVATIVSGFGFPKALQGKAEGDLPFFKVGDISTAWKSGRQMLTTAQHYLSEEEAKSIKARAFPKGTIVFAKIGEAIKLNRRAILGQPALVDNNVMGLIPDYEVVDHRYLFYWTLTQKLGDISQATTVPSIRKSDVEELEFPLVHVDQQKYIVAEIEKQFSRLDEAVANLKRVKANLKRYKAAVLKAAVEGRLVETEAELARREGRSYETGAQLLQRILETRRSQWKGKGKYKYKEPAAPDTTGLPELPEGWVWSNFETAAERVTVGHVGSMKDEYVEQGVPFLRSQNVRANRYDPEGLKFISQEFHRQLGKSTLRPGDIVVVRSGSVGVSCVIPDHLTEANCSDLVIIKEPRGVLPHYGAYYMNSVVETRVAAGKVGVALTHFNTQSVAELPLPVPPMAEQHRIVAEVDRRLSLIREVDSQVDASFVRSDRLRQSILERAFSGHIVHVDDRSVSAKTTQLSESA